MTISELTGLKLVSSTVRYETYKTTPNLLTSAETQDLKSTMFQTAVFYPAVCALLEILVLLPYRMKLKEGQISLVKLVKSWFKRDRSIVLEEPAKWQDDSLGSKST